MNTEVWRYAKQHIKYMVNFLHGLKYRYIFTADFNTNNMKTLQNFCDANDLKLVTIRYRHQFGYCSRKGFDIVRPETNEILFSIEPCNYLNGDKWHVYHAHSEYSGPRYFKKICRAMVKLIDTNATSFMRLG